MNLERSAERSWASLGCLTSGASYFAGDSEAVGVMTCLPAGVVVVVQPLLVSSVEDPFCRGRIVFGLWSWDPWPWGCGSEWWCECV